MQTYRASSFISSSTLPRGLGCAFAPFQVLAVGFALLAAGCGAHRITSLPPGATVYALPDRAAWCWRGPEGDWGVPPEPWEMYELRQLGGGILVFTYSDNKDWKTPVSIKGGPDAIWYQVAKPGYEDSEIVYFPPEIFKTYHHCFRLKPKDATQRHVRDRQPSAADTQPDLINAIGQSLNTRTGWAALTDVHVDPKGLSFTKQTFTEQSGCKLKFRDRVCLFYKDIGYIQQQEIFCPRGGVGHRLLVFQAGPKRIAKEIVATDIRNPDHSRPFPVNLEVNPTVFFFPPQYTMEKESFLRALRTLCPNLTETPMKETEHGYEFPDNSGE